MSNPKISVILAIYNVQDYLDECLKSYLITLPIFGNGFLIVFLLSKAAGGL